MDRRGMELAVNTLVVIILGVIIVGGGIALIYKIVASAEKMPGEIDRRTEQQLFDMLITSGEKVVVLNNVRTGERKDAVVFPVAIQNLADGPQTAFVVDLGSGWPATSVDRNGEEIPDCTNEDSCPHAITSDEEYRIDRFKSKAFYVMVNIPGAAKTGEYAFVVNIYKDSVSDANFYARTKLNVKVE